MAESALVSGPRLLAALAVCVLLAATALASIEVGLLVALVVYFAGKTVESLLAAVVRTPNASP